MPIKINKKLTLDIAKNFNNIQQKYLDLAPEIIKENILKSMNRGESPVLGGEWKTPYSESYQKAIQTKWGSIFGKRTSPVNLKLTGQLHNDLEVTPKGNKMVVGFNKTSEWLAIIHNENGRRVLPNEDGEDFNNSIQNKMDILLRQIVKNFIK